MIPPPAAIHPSLFLGSGRCLKERGAEKRYNPRHAAEFWMIEPEMAFADLNTYMDTAEAMTKYVIRYLLDNCPDELAFFNQFFDKGLILSLIQSDAADE